MATIPDSVRAFLATGPLAHIVTLGPDGTPHVSLAWAGFEGDEVVFATFFNTDQYKLRNLRRDPRVTLSFEAKEHTGEGLHPYVVIRGRARLTEGGARSWTVSRRRTSVRDRSSRCATCPRAS